MEAILAGMIVYSGYTCIRMFRRNIRHSLLFIAVEDILFWLGTAVYLFVKMYQTSDGSIRWYFVLGVIFGAAACRALAAILKKIMGKHGKRKIIPKNY